MARDDDLLASSQANTSTGSSPEYTGFYRARVVDVKDPKKAGRVKVWIPHIMEGKVEPSDGRWARPHSIYGGATLEQGDKKQANST